MWFKRMLALVISTMLVVLLTGIGVAYAAAEPEKDTRPDGLSTALLERLGITVTFGPVTVLSGERYSQTITLENTTGQRFVQELKGCYWGGNHPTAGNVRSVWGGMIAMEGSGFALADSERIWILDSQNLAAKPRILSVPQGQLLLNASWIPGAGLAVLHGDDAATYVTQYNLSWQVSYCQQVLGGEYALDDYWRVLRVNPVELDPMGEMDKLTLPDGSVAYCLRRAEGGLRLYCLSTPETSASLYPSIQHTQGNKAFELWEGPKEGQQLALYREDGFLKRYFWGEAVLHPYFEQMTDPFQPGQRQVTVQPDKPIISIQSNPPKMTVTLDFTKKKLEASYDYTPQDFTEDDAEDRFFANEQIAASADDGAELWTMEAVYGWDYVPAVATLYHPQAGLVQPLEVVDAPQCDAIFLDSRYLLVLDDIDFTLYDPTTGIPRKNQIGSIRWQGKDYWPLGFAWDEASRQILVACREAGYPEKWYQEQAGCLLFSYDVLGQQGWVKDTGIQIPYADKIFLYRVGLQIEGREVQILDYNDKILGSVLFK